MLYIQTSNIIKISMFLHDSLVTVSQSNLCPYWCITKDIKKPSVLTCIQINYFIPPGGQCTIFFNAGKNLHTCL